METPKYYIPAVREYWPWAQDEHESQACAEVARSLVLKQLAELNLVVDVEISRELKVSSYGEGASRAHYAFTNIPLSVLRDVAARERALRKQEKAIQDKERRKANGGGEIKPFFLGGSVKPLAAKKERPKTPKPVVPTSTGTLDPSALFGSFAVGPRKSP